MKKIEIPTKLNSKEVDQWLKGKYLLELVGRYTQNGITLVISDQWMKQIYSPLDIWVYGYNGIKIGEFKFENGGCNGSYYPIIRFYNQLSYLGSLGYCCSDSLTTDVSITRVSDSDKTEISTDDLFEAVMTSWNKVINHFKSFE